MVTHLERQMLWHGSLNVHLRVGCCFTGVDKITRLWASANRHFLASFTVYYAEWDVYGRPAGPIRNGKMLRGQENDHDPNPDIMTDKLLGFPQPGADWNKPGSGTIGCIKDAGSHGVHVDVPGYRAPM